MNCEFSLFNESMTKSESEYAMCMYGSLDHWIMMYHVSHVTVTCFSFIFNIYYIFIINNYIYIYSTLDVPKYPVSKSAVPVPMFPGNIAKY